MDQPSGAEGLNLSQDFHHLLSRRALEQTQDVERLREAALTLLDSHLGQRRMIQDLIAQQLGIPAARAAG